RSPIPRAVRMDGLHLAAFAWIRIAAPAGRPDSIPPHDIFGPALGAEQHGTQFSTCACRRNGRGALNVFLILTFGYPFSGDLSVSPESFRAALARPHFGRAVFGALCVYPPEQFGKHDIARLISRIAFDTWARPFMSILRQ